MAHVSMHWEVAEAAVHRGPWGAMRRSLDCHLMRWAACEEFEQRMATEHLCFRRLRGKRLEMVGRSWGAQPANSGGEWGALRL